jgi:hypothetical protein
MNFFLVITFILLASCSTVENDAKEELALKEFCWGAGDWSATYSFQGNGNVLVTEYDSYLITSKTVNGKAKIVGDKVIISWGGQHEEFAFDPVTKIVNPPSYSDGCGL